MTVHPYDRFSANIRQEKLIKVCCVNLPYDHVSHPEAIKIKKGLSE
ncbi:hypothetical protein BACEGG_00987 [Bacteroides eggerthii DSM 20697]|nr:hypothetical protein BACEGG_00987 [Bacteroides eggerthii DSM 20697]